MLQITQGIWQHPRGELRLINRNIPVIVVLNRIADALDGEEDKSVIMAVDDYELTKEEIQNTIEQAVQVMPIEADRMRLRSIVAWMVGDYTTDELELQAHRQATQLADILFGTIARIATEQELYLLQSAS